MLSAYLYNASFSWLSDMAYSAIKGFNIINIIVLLLLLLLYLLLFVTTNCFIIFFHSTYDNMRDVKPQLEKNSLQFTTVRQQFRLLIVRA
jgi:hypothetical protein